MKHTLLIVVLLIGFATPLSAQSNNEPVMLPDGVMKQVVGRMVTWYIKPRRWPTTIYFSNSNLKKEWLPAIRGVKFVLIDGDEYQEGKKGYAFDSVGRDGHRFTIALGYGELGCPGGGQGDPWVFYFSHSRVHIFQRRGNYGWSCNAVAALIEDGLDLLG